MDDPTGATNRSTLILWRLRDGLASIVLSRWGRCSSLKRALSTASTSKAAGWATSLARALVRIRRIVPLLLSAFGFASSRLRSDTGGGVDMRTVLLVDGCFDSPMVLLEEPMISTNGDAAVWCLSKPQGLRAWS